MTTRLAWLLVILLASPARVVGDPGSTAALETQIRELDLAHASAIFRGDAKALDRLMDDEVTVNHPTNRIVKEKRELLDLIDQGVIRYTTFERRPERFLHFDDMVVVMGGEVVVPAPGAPNAGKTLQRRYTNVWMRRDGKWRLVVRHANNVCPIADGTSQRPLSRSRIHCEACAAKIERTASANPN